MRDDGSVLLTRTDVARLLTLSDCIAAVENAFRMYGRKELSDPAALGVPCGGGGFHIKAALYKDGDRHYFAAKTNANFPANPTHFSLPTIQGVVLLFDATNGIPLAIMDSTELTRLRTAAATAVAAKYLARADSTTLAICGCGAQAEAQLKSVTTVLPISRCWLYDVNPIKAEALAANLANSGLMLEVAASAKEALSNADVCVTCTPSRNPFVYDGMVREGTFIAAVGADNPDKQEIDPGLLKHSKVVVDVLEQCATIGDLHHAIAAGVMSRTDVYGELGAVVAGLAIGRENDEEIIVFDSTGIALEDAAAACSVYAKALYDEAVSRSHLSS